MKKAIILARVSTEEQDSNEAQSERLKKFAADKGFDKPKIYEIEESSSKADRKKFQAILDTIEKSKDTVHLFVDTIDRLQRSFKESVILDDMRKAGKVEIYFFRENLHLHKESNSSDLIRWDMGVMFARSYVLQLSDNVKRKFEQMLRTGKWIGQPRLGYQTIEDNNGDRHFVLDPKVAPLVRRAFELYASGKYSVKTLREQLTKDGLRTRNGKKIAPSAVNRLLRDPFYHGIMVSKGKEYEHRYDCIVSKDLFNKCQKVLDSYRKLPFKKQAKPFVFKGLLRCKRCGCAISPELKKGKYVYYSCTNYKGMCKRVFVPEPELLEPVYEMLESLQLPQNKIDYIVAGLRKSNEAKTTYHDQAIKALDSEYMKVQKMLDNLLEMKLQDADSITPDEYAKKQKELKERQHELNIQKESHTKADEDYHITASMLLDLAKRAKSIFKSSEVAEKQQILKYLLQNSTLNGRKLEFTMRSPFNLIADAKHQPIGLRRQDSNL